MKRRGSRPPRNPDERRHVQFQVTQKEHELLKLRAGDEPLTLYAARMCLPDRERTKLAFSRRDRGLNVGLRAVLQKNVMAMQAFELYPHAPEQYRPAFEEAYKAMLLYSSLALKVDK